ncbi:MAG: hypothetical protein KGQ37_10045 [Hyphomicrobiales bacterium]|nr:hypothetical protein [Hyphomicrobiales bacterium]
MKAFAIAASLLTLVALPTRVWACPGQAGKVIFSDNFADDTGGWDPSRGKWVKAGDYVVTLPKGDYVTDDFNQTFNTENGDFCVVGKFPTGKPDPKNPSAVRLIFWGADYNNYFELHVGDDKDVFLSKLDKNVFHNIWDMPNSDAVNNAPGGDNTLRVIVKDQKISAYVNGKLIKVVRAQQPNGANKFGFGASFTNQKAPIDTKFHFEKFKVTAVP